MDDDPLVLRALRSLLRIRGFEPRTFESAGEFLDALPDGAPECMILDLQMPGLTGLELLQELVRRGIEIPTIVITAQDDTMVRERCKSAGVVAFLVKPLERATLFTAIDRARGAASQ